MSTEIEEWSNAVGEGCCEGDGRCVGALAIRLLASVPDSLKGDEMTVGKGVELRT